jgi:hypothetical protein
MYLLYIPCGAAHLCQTSSRCFFFFVLAPPLRANRGAHGEPGGKIAISVCKSPEGAKQGINQCSELKMRIKVERKRRNEKKEERRKKKEIIQVHSCVIVLNDRPCTYASLSDPINSTCRV